MKEKIQSLVNELNHYTDLYEQSNSPISDTEWDRKFFKLVELERETGIILPDSPTQSVRAAEIKGYTQVPLETPMLSLKKTRLKEDIEAMCDGSPIIGMPKFDGISARIIYKNGCIEQVLTRGPRGVFGTDLTHNAIALRNLPLTLPQPISLVVEGEIFIKKTDVTEDDNISSYRASANGAMKSYKTEAALKMPLSFVAWDCPSDDCSPYLGARLDYLKGLGFMTSPYALDDIEATFEMYNCLKDEYPLDGLVFKYDDISEYQQKGATAHHPNGAIAYKFCDEELETTLEAIEWSAGKTGALTPVAIFAPITFSDPAVTVTRATCHSAATLIDLFGNKPYRGQPLVVTLKNMVVPQIIEAEKEPAGDNIEYIDMPTVCPACGAPVKDFTCNNDDCSGKVAKRVESAAKALMIKGFGETTIAALIDKGLLTSVEDFFNLDIDKLMTAGLTKTKAAKLMKSIEDSYENASLAQILTAASKGIGSLKSVIALTEFFNNDYEEIKSLWKNQRHTKLLTLVKAESAISKIVKAGADRIDINFDLVDKILPRFKINLTN